MRFALIHKASSYLMVATGFAAAYFGGEVHAAVGAAFLVMLGVSWYWEPPRVDRDRFVRAWNVVTALAFLCTLADAFVYDGDVILAAFHFLAFLQANKLFNRRTSKDYLHMYVLSFLMLTLATTLNTELNYSAWFVLYLVFTTWTLILFHLKREMEDNYLLKHSEDASRSRKVEIQRILNSRRIVGASFLAATSTISVVAFLLSATLFFLFPRVGFGLFFANRRTGTSIAGFSDHVELGTFGLIRDNPSIVMRVEMDDSTALAEQGKLRWRGATYDTYDGHTWSRRSRRGRVLDKYEGRFYVNARDHALLDHERLHEQVIYLEPLDTRFLFGLDRPAQVEVHDGPQELPQGAVYEVKSNDYGDLQLTVSSTLSGTRIARWTDPDRFVSNPAVHYTVWSDLSRPADGSLEDTLPFPPALLRRAWPYLQLPEGLDPRVRQLAESLTRGRTRLIDKARAVEQHLRSAYRYTTRLERDERLAPLEDFLFVQKRGHCEYFATAMVILLRTIDIPARYVSGFYGGQWNRYGDYLAVSHGDAHSWVEVPFPGQARWLAFEPTPAGQGHGRLRSGAYYNVLLYLDALRLKWYRYVIEYDLNQQFHAVDRLRDVLPRLFSPSPPGERTMPRLKRMVRKRPGLLAALAGGLVLVVTGVVLALRRRRLSAVPRRRTSPAGHRGTRLYLLLLRLLARRGHAKAASDTALEFLMQMQQRGTPEEASVTREVTGRYLEARFGEVPLSEQDAARLASRMRGLGRRPPAG